MQTVSARVGPGPAADRSGGRLFTVECVSSSLLIGKTFLIFFVLYQKEYLQSRYIGSSRPCRYWNG